MKFPYKDISATAMFGFRFYSTPNNNYYPSITTVLGNTISEEKRESLKRWQTSLGEEAAALFTKEAADAGTNVHLLIERFLKNEPLTQGDEFTVKEMSLFNSIRLKLKRITEVWGQEVPLYSNRLAIAGRCDCIGIYNDKACIIDFKTSTRLKTKKDIEDYKLQLCAYAEMHNEMFDTNITDGVILMTSAGGFPQEFSVNLLDYRDILESRVKEFYTQLDIVLNKEGVEA